MGGPSCLKASSLKTDKFLLKPNEFNGRKRKRNVHNKLDGFFFGNI